MLLRSNLNKFKRFLSQTNNQSGDVAKRRLQKAIMQSHLNMSPQLMELLEEDVLFAFQRYVPVSKKNVELKWKRVKDSEDEAEMIELIAKIPLVSNKS